MAQTPFPVTLSDAGSHLVLHNITWEMYEQLLEVFAEYPQLRMTYNRGTLELMTPLAEHESYSWNLSRLIAILSEELGLEIRGLKSTTWRSQVQAVGKEADDSFYIQNEPAIRAKLKINLTVDPPPDLVIEIDTTHFFIDKMSVYEGLNVPEIWQYQKGEITIYILTEAGYVESEMSLAFGSFPVKELVKFMELDSQKGENARMREFREWVKSQL
ncbi:MAG: Uma2 family endonuclease [Desertifilum sp. SIO1I2]|nr:Uma2 family endonuclease [Desertifilum sp. SIO1I2]